MINEPLPGMPPDPPASGEAPAGVYIRRYRPRTRMLCHRCCELIHELGVAKAPLPAPVRWQVTVGSLTTHLCEEHKTEKVKEYSR